MNTRTIRTVVLAALLAGAGGAYADPHGQGMGMGTGSRMMGHGGMMGQGMMGMGQGMMGMGQGQGMMGMGMGMGMGRMMGLPDLSDKQRQTMIQRHRQMEKRMLDLEKQGLDARFALEDAMSKDTPDPQAVGRAMQGMFDVHKQMVEAAIATHNDMLGMLTDEQRQTLKTNPRAGMGSKMSGGRGPMMQQKPSNQ